MFHNFYSQKVSLQRYFKLILMNNDFRVGMIFQVTETQSGRMVAHHYIEPIESKHKIVVID
jgi:hypothetical protein